MSNEKPPLPTNDELALIGAALLDMVGTTMTFGHTNPGHVLDYVNLDQQSVFWVQVVRDFTAWTSRRKVMGSEAAGERLANYVRDSGWQRIQLNRAADALDLSEKAS